MLLPKPSFVAIWGFYTLIMGFDRLKISLKPLFDSIFAVDIQSLVLFNLMQENYVVEFIKYRCGNATHRDRRSNYGSDYYGGAC